MKIALLAATILFAACATNRPAKLNDAASTSRSDYTRDASECERQAALASAGSKAQAFNNCMKARNQTPKKQ